MIVTILGKKGAGKSTLTKNYLCSLGGRAVFLSPVENLTVSHTETWKHVEIPGCMEKLRPGNILVVRRADQLALDIICAKAIADSTGFTILIDEADRYEQSHQFEDAIHYSRHCRINIVANTRRYANMPRLLTSQADTMCIFQTHEPADLEYIRKLGGKEFCETIRNLPLYRYIEYPSMAVKMTKKSLI